MIITYLERFYVATVKYRRAVFRILGSVQRLTDPDPALFVNGFRETDKKSIFFLCFFLLFTYFRNIYISLQRWQVKTVEIKVIYFFAC
jgi:hypothetical protein